MPVSVVNCPECGERVKVLPGSKNPQQCNFCNTKFNFISRTVKIRIGIDETLADQIIATFSKAGQWFLDQLGKIMKSINIIPAHKSICAGCHKEKNLTIEKEGKMFCSSCGKNLILNISLDLLPLAKEKFELPNRMMVNLAFKRAQSLFFRWLSDNWKKIAVRQEKLLFIQKKKEKAVKASPNEDPEIIRIRELWKQSSGTLCILGFFNYYWRAPDISKDKRRARRRRLKLLTLTQQKSVSKEGKASKKILRLPYNKLPDLAWSVAKPFCENCEYFERYDWGMECKLQTQLNRELRLSRFPSFPNTLADIPPQSYKFSSEEITLFPRSKMGKIVAKIHSPHWLKNQGYEYEDFDSSRQAFIWKQPSRPWKSAEHRQRPRYYLIYPERRVVKVKPGPWLHVVAYGPTLTCVLSQKDDEKKIAYFRHPEILVIKEKYRRQRREPKVPEAILRKLFSSQGSELPIPILLNAVRSLEAKGKLPPKIKAPKTKKTFLRWFQRQPTAIKEIVEKEAEALAQKTKKASIRGYFKRPRQKEGRIIKNIIHNETTDIVEQILSSSPGKVVILHFEKRIFSKGVLGRRELNIASANWGDSLFRFLLRYKGEMAGLTVEEQKFDLTRLAICPFCEAEIGKSWQDLIIIDGLANAKCHCSKDFNLIWAIGEIALRERRG